MVEDLSAIVLAGGQSARMGQDKALLRVEGVPLLRRVCEAALCCADPVWVVTYWGDHYQSLLPDRCLLVPEQRLTDSSTPHGPLVGFAQGLAAVTTEWVLLLACDLPRLRGDVLQDWTTQLPQVAPDCIALLPRHPKGWEPLCGFYRRACLPSLEAFVQQGGRSFQRWLDQEKVQELAIADSRILLNCNTPEEWQQSFN